MLRNTCNFDGIDLISFLAKNCDTLNKENSAIDHVDMACMYCVLKS